MQDQKLSRLFEDHEPELAEVELDFLVVAQGMADRVMGEVGLAIAQAIQDITDCGGHDIDLTWQEPFAVVSDVNGVDDEPPRC